MEVRNSDMIVQVQEGELRGVKKESILTDRPYCAFLGIPYAKPPIGELRFQDPVPIGTWDDVWDASNEGSDCYQVADEKPIENPELFGSEDCLYLNVYTPEEPSRIKTRKAVMVFIHGGGFRCQSGSSAFYGPDYLINHDIMFNAGFLNTGTSNCTGNAGLKDQLLAIKWVKRNISNFGGDPENITLFGESAGAASVHLHILSPLSQGLFARAILQSGTALSPWTIEKDPELQARRIGKLAGYEGEDLEDLVEHLKSLPGERLCELAHRCHKDAHNENPGRCAVVMFIPSIEKIKDGAFLPDIPEKLMNSSTPVPTIIGFNDREGLLLYIAQAKESIDLVLDDFSIAVKDNFCLDEAEASELVSKIEKFYFHNSPITRANLNEVVDIYSDLYFIKFYQAIDHLLKSGKPLYMYLFAYDGKYNFLKNIVLQLYNRDLKGVCHGDELWYLFTQTWCPFDLDDGSEKMIRQCCELWTNFAKTGDPTPSCSGNILWRPHTADRPGLLRIDKKSEMFDEQLFEERLAFWKKYTTKFYR